MSLGFLKRMRKEAKDRNDRIFNRKRDAVCLQLCLINILKMLIQNQNSVHFPQFMKNQTPHFSFFGEEYI